MDNKNVGPHSGMALVSVISTINQFEAYLLHPFQTDKTVSDTSTDRADRPNTNGDSDKTNNKEADEDAQRDVEFDGAVMKQKLVSFLIQSMSKLQHCLE